MLKVGRLLARFDDVAFSSLTSCISAFAACFVLCQGTTTETNAQSADTFYSCADLSFLPAVENAGGKFFDAGIEDDAIEILKRKGVNSIRLRLWHSPPDGANSLAHVVDLARRIDEAGLGLFLDIHYSDTWADPGKQTPPASWDALDYETLLDSVESYTASVVGALNTVGVTPDIVQIGNEITTGILWDHGRVGESFDTPAQWARLAGIINRARDGILSVATGDILTMIHIDRGGDLAGAIWFFDNLLSAGATFDLIGLSFYPWWHGTLTDLDATLNTLASRYNRQMVVAETAYPWTLAWFDDEHNIVGLEEQLHDGYSATPTGQAAFIADLIEIVAGNDLGSGVCYWAPDNISTATRPSFWENVTLFDQLGNTLPAADALGQIPRTHLNVLDKLDDLNIFPNPASSTLNVSGIHYAGCGQVDIVNVLGRHVQSRTICFDNSTVRVPIDELAAGHYFVRLSFDERVPNQTQYISVIR